MFGNSIIGGVEQKFDTFDCDASSKKFASLFFFCLLLQTHRLIMRFSKKKSFEAFARCHLRWCVSHPNIMVKIYVIYSNCCAMEKKNP
jgi:hypothetical protein